MNTQEYLIRDSKEHMRAKERAANRGDWAAWDRIRKAMERNAKKQEKARG